VWASSTNHTAAMLALIGAKADLHLPDVVSESKTRREFVYMGSLTERYFYLHTLLMFGFQDTPSMVCASCLMCGVLQ
jgi:hypothetical protein